MKLKVITSNPEVLGGTPVFEGTRVPLQTLIDYLQAGDSIDAFLEDFPTIMLTLILLVQEVGKCN
jgi:uncharacterized protein (DUF433 family)